MMTKDEIKKCLSYDIGLKQDALNLIIEQEKEIERLKTEYGKLQIIAEILARVVRDLNNKIS